MIKLRFIPELLKNAGHWLAVVCLLAVAAQVSAQCSPDITQPVAVCKEALNISLNSAGEASITAAIIDEGSYDDCCLNASEGLLIRRAGSTIYLTEVNLNCSDINTPVDITLQVTDCAGNSNTCLTTITLKDALAPTCVAPADVTLTCDQFNADLLVYGAVTSEDNCCVGDVIENRTENGLPCGTLYQRKFKVTDCHGNFSQCTQSITVLANHNYTLNLPPDIWLTSGNIEEAYWPPVYSGTPCSSISMGYSDELVPILEDSILKIVRTWAMIDWCNVSTVLPEIEIPNPEPASGAYDPANFVGPIVSAQGTASEILVNGTDILPTNYATFFNPDHNLYHYNQYIYMDSIFSVVRGAVFADANEDCLKNSGELPWTAWKVKVVNQVTGVVYEAVTNDTGYYQVILPGGGNYHVFLDVPFNYVQFCPASYSLNINTGTMITQDIPVVLNDQCPILTVDISAPFLRRCFPNNYQVQACNLGTEPQEDAYVVVDLDPYMTLNSSTTASTSLGNNQYSFAVGDLAPGECRLFNINFTLACTAPVGATHCSEAHIFPDTLCGNPDWSGAIVQVDGYCDGDSVRMEIQNIGTGNMIETLNFIVVEDVIMRTDASGTFKLNTGETLGFALPANGATWRLEAEQESNYPWKGFSARAIEGCGGVNMNGLVNMFPLNTPNPFESIDCQPNVGSYDPNDKQGFPTGYGDNHYIKPNVDIDYRIRFQNTGTDTAFTVVVLDTLSEHLDIASVRPGASSHPYSFSVLDGGVLHFRFDHILLPDSNVNEVASHGFLRFSVAQKADLPDNTLIENTGAIYFDFNDAVITNTTTHLVGRNFIEEVSGVKDGQVVASALVYPNPALDVVVFKMPTGFATGVLELTNAMGQLVRSETIFQQHFRLERRNLPGGVYQYSILGADGVRFAGKVTFGSRY